MFGIGCANIAIGKEGKKGRVAKWRSLRGIDEHKLNYSWLQ